MKYFLLIAETNFFLNLWAYIVSNMLLVGVNTFRISIKVLHRMFSCFKIYFDLFSLISVTFYNMNSLSILLDL